MGLATGQIKTVIDRSFPREQVAAAHRYMGIIAYPPKRHISNSVLE